MRPKILWIMFAVSSIILTGCKKSEDKIVSPSTNEIQITQNSYPKNEGTNYKYSYIRNDSTGQSSGTRILFYKGKTTIQGTPYKILIDSLQISSVPNVDTSFFRDTLSGIYYFVDTTGFAASVTDSSLITQMPYIVFDEELLTYSFPLLINRSWTVFKINHSGAATTIVDVSATVIDPPEEVMINLSSGQVNKLALKVKFTLTFRLNSSSPGKNYIADCWLVPDIGNVKSEGNSALINFLMGLGVDFRDTSSTVTQNLIDYSIK